MNNPSFVDICDSDQPVTFIPYENESKNIVAKIDLQALALSRFGEWREEVSQLVNKYNNVAFAVQTTKGYDEARRALAEVRAPRYKAQNVSKESKSELAKVSKAVGAEEKAVIDTLAETEKNIELQIDAEDKRRANIKAEEKRKADEIKAAADRKESERREKHEAEIAKIISYATTAKSKNFDSKRLSAGIEYVRKLDIDGFEEFHNDAVWAKDNTIEELKELLASTIQRENEYARIEAQRIENERIAAEQAAERAKLDVQAQETKRQAEHFEMLMQEIQAIQHQVIIAQSGWRGVREGGTIQCIKDTLAETEAWEIGDHFGKMTEIAQAAKDRATADILRMLEAAVSKEKECEIIEDDLAVTIDPRTDPSQYTIQTLPPKTPEEKSKGLAWVAGLKEDDNKRYQEEQARRTAEIPSIKLGTLCAEIGEGFMMTEAFVSRLGVKASGRDKRAVLYTSSQRINIIGSFIVHLQEMLNE